MDIMDKQPLFTTTENEGKDGDSKALSLASALLRNVKFSKAVDLARGSRFMEAEQLLEEIRREVGETPRPLDLLARILAQQGRLGEAEALWRQAERLAPGNEAYKAALQRIAGLQRRPVWLVSALPFLAGLLVVIGLVVAGLAVKRYMNDLRVSIGSDLRAEAARIATEREKATPKPPEVRITVAGVSARTAASEVVVSFDSGLFGRGARLKSEAMTVLTALGRQLEPHIGRVSVHVVGFTDDVPMPAGDDYRDNTALGMDRSVAVVEHLRATAGLPANMFAVSSTGESGAPYPNDTQDNRIRNRTVVLKISNINR